MDNPSDFGAEPAGDGERTMPINAHINSTGNLLDWLEDSVRSNVPSASVIVTVPNLPQPSDARLFLRADRVTEADRADELIRVAREVDLDPIGLETNGIEVRFGRERLETLGLQLELGVPDALETREIEQGNDWLVNFGDPNATKAPRRPSA